MWYNRGANSIWVYGDFQTVTVMHNVPDLHDGMSGLMTLSVAVPSDELSRPNTFGVKVETESKFVVLALRLSSSLTVTLGFSTGGGAQVPLTTYPPFTTGVP
jgi:hypothetical protein